MIDEYFQQLLAHIAELPFVESTNLNLERRSDTVGFVRGDIYFADDSRLHVRELIATRNSGYLKYVYHYQKANGALVFRYDNAPHFPALSNFPHHKHQDTETNVTAATPPTLRDVLCEIESLIVIE